MKHEVRYDLTDPQAAEEKAIADCIEWLGVRQFNKVTKILKADAGSTSRDFVMFGLAMQGIQGYPAQVMVDKYWNRQRELDLA